MKVTLFLTDPDTGVYSGVTQEFDYPGSIDPFTLSPRQLWGAIGRNDAVGGTIWEPPSNNYIFDGQGWRLPEQLDADSLAKMLATGQITPDFALKYGKATPIVVVLTDIIKRTLEAINKKKEAKYTESEKATWQKQVEEAQGFLSGSFNDPPLLKTLALSEGRELSELASAVLEKAERYQDQQAQLLVRANEVRNLTAGWLASLSDKGKQSQVLTEASNLAKSLQEELFDGDQS